MLTALRLAGAGLAQGFFMLWKTLWALLLGFALSGAVQAFVTRARMERVLGRPGAGSVARATFLGMVSSSCSYAAAALARSLFAQGADLTASLVFMIASTNLVIELGIVLGLLIGWQFTASEFVGGVLMIAMFAVLARVLLPSRLIAAARRRLDTGGAPVARDVPTVVRAHPRSRVRTVAGWTDAAGYTVADITMLRRELVIGFTVAGLLAAAVPDAVWAHLFISGHGWASSLENVAVGPLIAILSFVCSIGNVPLAAALWKGGISFGGVVAFIFADLITLPLLVIYRRYYGTALTVRILACLWLVMSVSGLAVESLFGALHAIPQVRPARIAPETITWNATSVLNILAVGGFAVLVALARRGPQSAGVHARDPICGMHVEMSAAPVVRVRGDSRTYFCSEGCAERYDRDALEHVAPVPAARLR